MLYTQFFVGLVGSFLYAGKISVPRRWAMHLPEWIWSDVLGAVGGSFIILATLLFLFRFIANVRYAFVAKP